MGFDNSHLDIGLSFSELNGTEVSMQTDKFRYVNNSQRNFTTTKDN
jgi:hypothetical protein